MEINLVTFNIPYPPNYGGVIDVFYKIKYLNQMGVTIHLHTFQYGRPESNELLKYCKSVSYYPRKTNLFCHLSLLPYIVKSRKSRRLSYNLNSNQFPTLFEGLHTSYSISGLKRRSIIRSHNIEHSYYKLLARSEKCFWKRLFFHLESFKLKQYLKKIKDGVILAINEEENNFYLRNGFQSFYVPAFHPNSTIQSLEGSGKYLLFHGNLGVHENIDAVHFFLEQVVDVEETPFIIAGKNPGNQLKEKINNHKNAILVANPSEIEMQRLIQNAHIILLYTRQETGVKLKLINSLFLGRFCIANTSVVKNTGLETLCSVCNRPKEYKRTINSLMHQKFSGEQIEERRVLLNKYYSNIRNGEKIINIIKKLYPYD